MYVMTIDVPHLCNLSPKNLKNKIDVYLQSLIDELKELWDVGIETYEISMGQTFQIKAALRWTINDFPDMECYLGGVLMGN